MGISSPSIRLGHRIMTSELSDAYLTLAHWCEPTDPVVVASLEKWDALQVVEQIKRGVIKNRIRPETAHKIANFSVSRERDYAHSIGANIVTRGDIGWPTQLEKLNGDEPWALWSLGSANFRLLSARSLSIVGTRACTTYGSGIARSWAAEFATEGLTVISGGAIGIDVAAHQGALDVEAPTICILAGGVESRYPRANEAVFGKILESGAIVSESPPREAPRRQRFLSRNRLIAGLSEASLIVEAANRSGTETTARRAHEMNRLVMGVPGSVHSPASEGVHELIRSGTALLVHSPGEVLELMSARSANQEPLLESETRLTDKQDRDWRSLSQRELDVWESMPVRGAILVEDLVEASGHSMSSVIGALSELELTGRVAKDGFFWSRVV